MTIPGDAADTVVVRRLLPVPREQVFDAWLDPASVTQWMCPADGTHTTAEIDARVGGKFRIVMSHGGGEAEHWGEYLVIDRPALLRFTWVSVNTTLLPSEVTVELFDRGTSTELVLTHRRLPAAQVTAHRKGWREIIDRLRATLAPQSDGAT